VQCHRRFSVLQDADAFAEDFAAAFSKLLELGVPFDTPAEAASPGLQPNLGKN